MKQSGIEGEIRTDDAVEKSKTATELDKPESEIDWKDHSVIQRWRDTEAILSFGPDHPPRRS